MPSSGASARMPPSQRSEANALSCEKRIGVSCRSRLVSGSSTIASSTLSPLSDAASTNGSAGDIWPSVPPIAGPAIQPIPSAAFIAP